MNIKQIINLTGSLACAIQFFTQLSKRAQPPSTGVIYPSGHLRTRKKKVFICSTCEDLKDSRAELKKSLLKWGYEPLLNESSDFPVELGTDSYNACINAVKSCNLLVLIIGTRYGGIVEGEGISITEKEYRTACDLGIPRINFCLNKVWNLVQVVRENPGLKYPKFFTDEKAKVDKLFAFLDFVRKYKAGKTDNWVHPFEDSVQLKEILRYRLRNVSF